MAKYYGAIGFAETVETLPGVWEEHIVEKMYSGNFTRNLNRLQSADKLNDDIHVTNEINFIADPYAALNFHTIRYATYLGVKWKINNVEVKHPRLYLQLGSVYNDYESET